MINHKGVINRIEWMNSMYPLKEKDKILQKTPYTFDVSVWELLWANWYGAAIVLAKPEGHKDVNYLAELINKESITTIHFVPSMLGVFENVIKVNKEQLILVSGLRYIFCSGPCFFLISYLSFILSFSIYHKSDTLQVSKHSKRGNKTRMIFLSNNFLSDYCLSHF